MMKRERPSVFDDQTLTHECMVCKAKLPREILEYQRYYPSTDQSPVLVCPTHLFEALDLQKEREKEYACSLFEAIVRLSDEYKKEKHETPKP